MPSVVCVRSLVPNEKNSARLGDLARAQRRARQFDHRADLIGHRSRRSPWRRLRRMATMIGLMRSSSACPIASGIMISGVTGLPVFSARLDRALEDRARLHLRRSPDSGWRAARRGSRASGLNSCSSAARARSFSALTPIALATSSISASVLRQELVQRRIEQADRDRQPVHDLEQIRRNPGAASGAAWRARRGGPRSLSARIISRTATMRSPSKNMCSVRQRPMPSAPNARAARASVGVSALARTFMRLHRIGPGHEGGEIAGQLGLHHRRRARHHFAGAAVDGDDVALLQRHRARGHASVLA